jgi:hypothetical protein
VPASCADQFYVLRGHIAFVRNRLALMQSPPTGRDTGGGSIPNTYGTA